MHRARRQAARSCALNKMLWSSGSARSIPATPWALHAYRSDRRRSTRRRRRSADGEISPGHDQATWGHSSLRSARGARRPRGRGTTPRSRQRPGTAGRGCCPRCAPPPRVAGGARAPAFGPPFAEPCCAARRAPRRAAAGSHVRRRAAEPSPRMHTARSRRCSTCASAGSRAGKLCERRDGGDARRGCRPSTYARAR